MFLLLTVGCTIIQGKNINVTRTALSSLQPWLSYPTCWFILPTNSTTQISSHIFSQQNSPYQNQFLSQEQAQVEETYVTLANFDFGNAATMEITNLISGWPLEYILLFTTNLHCSATCSLLVK